MKKSVTNAVRRLAADEKGGATIEYALVAALLIIGSIAAIAAFGAKALARWNAVNSASL